MPLSEEEELELLELEEQEAMQSAPMGGTDPYGRPIARAESIREEYPSEKFVNRVMPMAQLGGMFAKTPGMGMGIAGAASAGTEIARQAIQAYGGEPGAPTTFGESLGRTGRAFATGAGGEAAARVIGRGAEKFIKPTAIKTGAQAMKIGAGIDERSGIKALSDPSRLRRAPSMEQAGEGYERAMTATGLEQGPEAAMKLMGKSALSQEGASGFAYDAIQKLAEGKLSYQEALVARDQLKNILKMPKWQNPSIAQNERFLVQMQKQLDDYLEPYFQEAGESFAQARKGYAEASLGKEFSSLLPTNANKTASVLRGASLVGAGYVDPETAVGGALLMSPYVLGKGIAYGLPAAGVAARAALREGIYMANPLKESGVGVDYSSNLQRKYNEQK